MGTKNTIRLALVILCASIAALAASQTRNSAFSERPVPLPTDNGVTASFQDTMSVGIDAWTACERIDTDPAFTCTPTEVRNAFLVRMSMQVDGHAVTSGGVVYTSCGILCYSFSDYRVDGTPIAEWDTGAAPATASKVHSVAYVMTVECIARMRGTWRDEYAAAQ
jgi:hypothetical protein